MKGDMGQKLVADNLQFEGICSYKTRKKQLTNLNLPLYSRQSVDIADFNRWLSAPPLTGPDWANADWNGDGFVDIADLIIWVCECPPGS